MAETAFGDTNEETSGEIKGETKAPSPRQSPSPSKWTRQIKLKVHAVAKMNVASRNANLLKIAHDEWNQIKVDLPEPSGESRDEAEGGSSRPRGPDLTEEKELESKVASELQVADAVARERERARREAKERRARRSTPEGLAALELPYDDASILAGQDPRFPGAEQLHPEMGIGSGYPDGLGSPMLRKSGGSGTWTPGSPQHNQWGGDISLQGSMQFGEGEGGAPDLVSTSNMRAAIQAARDSQHQASSRPQSGCGSRPPSGKKGVTFNLPREESSLSYPIQITRHGAGDSEHSAHSSEVGQELEATQNGQGGGGGNGHAPVDWIKLGGAAAAENFENHLHENDDMVRMGIPTVEGLEFETFEGHRSGLYTATPRRGNYSDPTGRFAPRPPSPGGPGMERPPSAKMFTSRKSALFHQRAMSIGEMRRLNHAERVGSHTHHVPNQRPSTATPSAPRIIPKRASSARLPMSQNERVPISLRTRKTSHMEHPRHQHHPQNNHHHHHHHSHGVPSSAPSSASSASRHHNYAGSHPHNQHHHPHHHPKSQHPSGPSSSQELELTGTTMRMGVAVPKGRYSSKGIVDDSEKSFVTVEGTVAGHNGFLPTCTSVVRPVTSDKIANYMQGREMLRTHMRDDGSGGGGCSREGAFPLKRDLEATLKISNQPVTSPSPGYGGGRGGAPSSPHIPASPHRPASPMQASYRGWASNGRQQGVSYVVNPKGDIVQRAPKPTRSQSARTNKRPNRHNMIKDYGTVGGQGIDEISSSTDFGPWGGDRDTSEMSLSARTGPIKVGLEVSKRERAIGEERPSTRMGIKVSSEPVGKNKSSYGVHMRAGELNVGTPTHQGRAWRTERRPLSAMAI